MNKNDTLIDVIGIGAINFDFIFNSKSGNDWSKPKETERGIEGLASMTNTRALVRMIDKLTCTTQIGGSAFLTIRTISSLNIGLKTAYVGCYGTPTEVENEAGFPNDIDSEFAFLGNRDWLFKTPEEPGRAIVRLYRGKRLMIDISPGANNSLKENIVKKEKSDEATTDLGSNSSFVQFLCKAKWIHITSLADIEQFKFIVEKMRKAKEINPLVKISVDPGYEYSKSHIETLKELFVFSDYIFLNENEFNNLIGGNELDRKTKIDVLNNLVADTATKETLVFIQKGRRRNEVLNFIGGKPFSRNFWHPLLNHWKIYNDTGAGDVFAGGVIAGLLTPHLLTHQPAAIRLGSILASIRLHSKDFPEKEFGRAYDRFIKNNLRNESINYYSMTKGFWEKFGKLITFVLGIIATIVAEKIFK
jgi:sugar/nucleoside kinase (ribokinase family)